MQNSSVCVTIRIIGWLTEISTMYTPLLDAFFSTSKLKGLHHISLHFTWHFYFWCDTVSLFATLHLYINYLKNWSSCSVPYCITKGFKQWRPSLLVHVQDLLHSQNQRVSVLTTLENMHTDERLAQWNFKINYQSETYKIKKNKKTTPDSEMKVGKHCVRLGAKSSSSAGFSKLLFQYFKSIRMTPTKKLNMLRFHLWYNLYSLFLKSKE